MGLGSKLIKRTIRLSGIASTLILSTIRLCWYQVKQSGIIFVWDGLTPNGRQVIIWTNDGPIKFNCANMDPWTPIGWFNSPFSCREYNWILSVQRQHFQYIQHIPCVTISFETAKRLSCNLYAGWHFKTCQVHRISGLPSIDYHLRKKVSFYFTGNITK